jgi:flavin-dependent thymidylate synthase
MQLEHHLKRMKRCDCPDGTAHVPGCAWATAEPTWLEERRDERGIIPHPVPSRDWGDYDERPLTRDVAFNRHSMNDGEHVGPSDNGKVNIGTDGIEVVLAQGIDEEAFKRTLSAATRATIGLDLSDPEVLNNSGDWEEMLKGGLQTALETQVIVFAVSGTSRTCTHQLVRSRRAGFHQQSQRASYMGDMPELRMPESIWRNLNARTAFLKLAMQSWSTYQEICEEDISYQDARFALLEGTTNFILLEYPVREFLNVYAYRGCSMFQWEIVHVMRECRRVLIEAHPWLEPYVKISCEKTGPAVIARTIRKVSGENQIAELTVPHHCTFQGWEDVEGQCEFAWAKQEARTFKPEHHRISRKGGES